MSDKLDLVIASVARIEEKLNNFANTCAAERISVARELVRHDEAIRSLERKNSRRWAIILAMVTALLGAAAITLGDRLWPPPAKPAADARKE